MVLNQSVFAADCGPKWCESASLSKVEKLICGDKSLRAADVLMSGVYKELMSYRGKEGHEGMWGREVSSNQKDWIEERNKMTESSKLMDAYMSRTQELYRNLQQRRDN